MITNQPAMAEPAHQIEHDYAGFRQWTFIQAITEHCREVSRARFVADVNAAVGREGFLMIDCGNFRRRGAGR